MPAVLVQKAFMRQANQDPALALSFPGAVTPGNTVFVSCVSYAGVANQYTIVDNQGNTYVRDFMVPTDGSSSVTHICFWRCDNVKATGTFTVTFDGNASSADLYIAEFSGLAGGAPDAHKSGRTSGTDFPGSQSLTPTQAADLFITIYDFGGNQSGSTVSISPNTPDAFTLIDTEPDGSAYNGGGWAYLAATAGDSAAKSVNAWTHALGDTSQIASWSITAYKTGVAGPSNPPQQLLPDADLATTGWSTAPLWSKVDEIPAGGDVISAVSS